MKGPVVTTRRPLKQQETSQPSRPIINDEVIARSMARRRQPQPFKVAEHPPGIMPPNSGMPMEDCLTSPMWWAGGFVSSGYLGDQYFIGYPELAALAQRPEFRRISEIIATEMTRIGIRFQSSGDADNTEKLARIDMAFKNFSIMDHFREVAKRDGYFGRGHLYVDFGTTDDPDELKTPIGNGRDKISEAKVGKGVIEGLQDG